MLKPPPDFRSNFDSTPPPILIDRGQAVLENEKIERYIMKSIPGGHNLFISDKETATTVENLYSVSLDPPPLTYLSIESNSVRIVTEIQTNAYETRGVLEKGTTRPLEEY